MGHAPTFEELLAGVETDPGSEAASRALERSANQLGRWPEAVQTVARRFESETDPERRIALALRLARWYSTRLQRPDYAVPYMQFVARQNPEHVGLLTLTGAFAISQPGLALEFLAKARAVATTSAELAQVLYETGRAYEEHGQLEQAEEHFRQALDLDVRHHATFEGLQRIFEVTGRPDDAAKAAAFLRELDAPHE